MTGKHIGNREKFRYIDVENAFVKGEVNSYKKDIGVCTDYGTVFCIGFLPGS